MIIATTSTSAVYLLAGIFVAVVATLGVVYKVAVWIRARLRMFDQLFGVEASRGVAAIPSVVERLGRVEGEMAAQGALLAKVATEVGTIGLAVKQLSPNNGSSMSDKVTRIEQKIDDFGTGA